MKTLARPRDAAALVERLQRLSPESTARWGRMSVHQMVCHLADSLRMVSGEKAVTHAGGVLQQTVLKWTVLYLPLPWPSGIPTSPEIDQERGGTKPVAFAADLAQVDALLHAMASRAPDVAPPPHPFFGRMSRAAWLRWAWLHTDHHLRQFGV